MKHFTKVMLLLMIFSLSATVIFGQNQAAKQAKLNSDVLSEYLAGPRAPDYVPNTSRGVILDESFEGTWLPTGWASTALVPPPTPAWDRTTSYPHTGSAAAWQHYTFNNSPTGQDSWLITPALDFSDAVPNYSFSFWQRGNWTGDQDFHEVAVSTDGVTWTQVYTGVPPEDAYEQIELDLSAYGGNATVYIGWHYQGYGADDWWIDDVLVESISLGNVEGYVFNGGGLAINGATIECAGETTHSLPSGYYLLTVPGGITQDVVASKSGYNTITESVYVPVGGVAYQEITLTAPDMTISPTAQNRTMHPNEYTSLPATGILNTGDGPLVWNASVVYPVTDGSGSPFHAPKFTGKIADDGVPVSTKAAPANAMIAEVNPVYPDVVLADNFGYIGAPSDDVLYQMDMGTYASSTIGSTVADPACGDFLNNDFTTMYVGANWGDDLYSVDVTTGAGTLIAPITGVSDGLSGMACDRTTGTMYISGTNVAQSYIGTIDLATGVVTQIGSNITNAPGIIDIAIDGTGQMYGWCIVTDAAYTIDKTTGVATLLGALGQNLNYGQGGNWDPNDDVIYMAAYTASGAQLLALDRTTGAASVLSGLPASQCAAFGVPGGGGGAGSWLTLDYYSGTVPPGGGLDNVPTNFDAAGTNAGEVYTADIVFTSDPDVGTITIPCMMTIMGDPLVPPTDLVVTVTDEVIGEVLVEWQWTTDAFQYFVVKRDGGFVGTTAATSFTDNLPDFGTYCYTVQAVYDEGSTSPAGPECVEWYIPDICWDPSNPTNTQWIDVEAAVALEIENCGEGTLEFTFPEYVVTDLLNDPNFVHNKVGDPWEGQEFDIAKGEDDPRDGQGYPVNRGAGGPDAFGYTWIDSDEAGGPIYSFEDISGTGTLVPFPYSDDGITGPFSIGFDFPFYDVAQTQFWIASNGCITFDNPYGSYFSLSNQSIPTGNYTNLIAWFWDDLRPRDASGTRMYYQTFADRLVIQFENYFEFPYSGGRYVDAEVILYKNGQILINYDFFSATFDMDSETIGIQSADDAVGLQVAYNTTYAHDGLALLFIPPQPHFVIDVEPAHGFLTEGQTMDLELTYSSVGFDPGTYFEDIDVMTNAPAPQDMVLIPNTMIVYYPGELAGTVTDCNTGLPIAGATVSAGAWQGVTATDGTYAFYLDAGTYDVDFDKLGYQSYTEAGVVVPENVQTIVDASLCEMPYAPAYVVAETNQLDTECQVDWALPLGPYEILYDDGSAEDLALWAAAGGENAVKFTPLGYPATIIGGRVFVGDGNFPAGGFLGSSFSMVIYDDDGTDGMPGTVLDSIPVTVGNFGWITFSGGTATITEGDFYMSMLQTQPSPAAPIGVDYSLPTVYRSYQRYGSFGWQLSVYQDFMIRAFVEGPNTTDGVADGTDIVKPEYYLKKGALGTVILSQTGTHPIVTSGVVGGGEVSIKNVPNGTANRDLTFYEIARVSDFDPTVGPASGTITPLATNIIVQDYNDLAWGALLPGWYAYAVRAYYTNGDSSPWTYSNIVQHQLDWEVTFEVTICDGSDPDGVLVTMDGRDYPFNLYSAVTDVTGLIVFDSVIQGRYDITASKIGFEEISFSEIIAADVTYPLNMCDNRFPPTGMVVDPLTSYAYWNYPFAPTVTEENFDGAFPPEGWTTSSNGQGWFPTTDGSSSAWTIPTWTSQYACSNDDGAGSGNDGSVDYLITPPLLLGNGTGLFFDSFYTGTFSQLAFVEFSTDEGATWTELEAMTASASWESISVDLTPITSLGQYPVWIAFHADDDGAWASGWAIDNVAITDGNPPQPDPTPLGFHLFLDGAFVGTADTNFYQYQNLTYGVTYEACVAALYCCGLSSQSCYTFTSNYLLPPRNLDGLSFDNAVEVWWNPPVVPVTDASDISIPAYSGPAIVSTVPQLADRDNSSNPREAINPIANETPIDGGNRGSTAWGLPGYYGDAEWVFFDADVPGTFNIIEPDPSYNAFCGDFTKGNNDDFYMIDADDGNLFYVDILTGVPTVVGNTGLGINVPGLAVNRNTGVMYAITTSLYTVDIATGTTTLVGPLTGSAGLMIAIACDNSGNLWGIDITDDNLYSIDPATGACTIVGSTGYAANYAQDMGFDPISGNLYWGAYGGGLDGNLRIVDTSTGNSALVGTLSGGAELTALGFPGGGGGGGGTVPDNLLGYNLYRDMDNIAYIPYNDEDTSYYLDLDLNPMCYDYDVTALYDLTTYGFPGEIGESMYEGTFNVCVEYGWPLPFVEDWNTGSFDPNLWTAGENWVVNGQYGNPMPCSEFKWDPVLTDYRSALVSYPLDGKYHPGTTDPYIDGRIWFEFDLSLNDNSMSGAELLHVQVWENGDWFDVATFDNTDGNFDWKSYKFDISDKAFGNIFKVRFAAEGVNSADILSWYVDNVNIYRECDAPRELTADGINPTTIELNWTSPVSSGGGGGTAEWLMWDDGVNAGDGIGLTAGGTFSVASHWDASSITQYDGMYIEKIRFFVYDNAVTSTFALKVWTGASATMVYEQAVTGAVAGAWNEIVLTTPVMIDAAEELWFGYTVTQPVGENPAGFDFGPVVPGYGDMVDLGTGFESLAGLLAGFDGNFNLQAYISDMTTDAPSIPMTYVEDKSVFTTPNGTFSESGLGLAPTSVDDYATRALTGYNVYWNDDGAGYEFLEFTTDTFYTHIVDPAFAVGTTQCYYVTAAFEDCEPASNEACVVVTGIENPEIADGISVYPNPARDILNVTSTSDISHVTIMNYVGQVVYNQKVVEDNDLQLNVAGYETGVYMVKVETSAGVIVKKVTIAH